MSHTPGPWTACREQGSAMESAKAGYYDCQCSAVLLDGGAK